MKKIKNLQFIFKLILGIILLLLFGYFNFEFINENDKIDILTKMCNFEVNEMELNDCLKVVDKIKVYNEGKIDTLLISDNEYSLILNEIEYMLEDAREMPAFGVSLDDYTRRELKNGLWVELLFKNQLTHNGMSFESLLVNVVPDYSGFNIIRKYKDKYEGRCFYIDLNGKNMKNLYNILISN